MGNLQIFTRRCHAVAQPWRKHSMVLMCIQLGSEKYMRFLLKRVKNWYKWAVTLRRRWHYAQEYTMKSETGKWDLEHIQWFEDTQEWKWYTKQDTESPKMVKFTKIHKQRTVLMLSSGSNSHQMFALIKTTFHSEQNYTNLDELVSSTKLTCQGVEHKWRESDQVKH